MASGVSVRLLFELLGKPREYVESSMKKYVESMKKAEHSITSEKFMEVKELEEGVFSTLAEVEVSFDKAGDLFGFCLDFMPASVEILEPETLSIDSHKFSEFINDIQARVHRSDMIVKDLQAKAELVDRNSITIFENFVVTLLKNGAMAADELQKATGVNVVSLPLFLKRLIDKKTVMFDGKVYKLS